MPRIVDPFYGYIPLEEYEEKLIDTMLFQRLRGIHQSGTAFLTYPASNHTRFQHSLGVMHVASRAYDFLWSNYLDDLEHDTKEVLGKTVDNPSKCFRPLIRLASLLHDLCHGPFSHVSELVCARATKHKKPHETILLQLLQSTDKISLTNLIKEKVKKNIPEIEEVLAALPHFFEESNIKFKEKDLYYGNFYKKLIDGEIDADNMDYLIRDTYVTGSPILWLDIETILQNICYINERILKNKFEEFKKRIKGKLKDDWSSITFKIDNLKLDDYIDHYLKHLDYSIIFGKRSISALENFVIARRKLYRWLNFHHTVCFTDELMYRMIRLGIIAGSFKEEYFGEEAYKELIALDMNKKLSGKSNGKVRLKAKDNNGSIVIIQDVDADSIPIVDDHFIIEKIRRIRKDSMVDKYAKDEIEGKNAVDQICEYYRMMMRLSDYKPLWKVSLVEIKETEGLIKAWRKLGEIRGESMRNASYKFDETINAKEREINDKIMENYGSEFKDEPSPIIAFKPYHAIKQNFYPVIMVNEDRKNPELKVLDEIPNIIPQLRQASKDVALYVYFKMPKQHIDDQKLNNIIEDSIEILIE